MLIQTVNRPPLKNLQEFETALKAAAQKPPVVFLMNNHGVCRHIVLATPQ